ncbi:beta-galactosidase [Sandarakinorhabdus sp. DWP1-3-1]|uniref:beta-galactosidase n=1 Tax=Sandarakinorhabdus sp. DWP1-3-1 TaxID=2804627 RepID=UPI003CE69A7E
MRVWRGVLGLLGATLLAAAAPVAPPVPTGAAGPLAYGTAWYPEQWPEATWDADLQRMQAAGFTFVRVAEFAWSTIEPTEGRYDWAWLDRAIAKAAAHDLKVVLGTPTAAPPAWLTARYPEVLLVEEDGRPARHGARRHFSVGSALYRQKAAAIAGAMAARYGGKPAVIGVQVDNEYGRATFDAETRRRFQQWLRAKYSSIDRFNAAYHGAQWSLAYSDWAQVPIPGAGDSPSLYLDWLRFFSEQWRDYQQVQIDAIRPHLPGDRFITTNFTGRYDNFDFALTAQPLDLVSWDWYFPGPRVDPAEGGLLHDMNRGFLGRNFWIMETAPGNTNWAERNYTMPRGEVRAMAWQAVGHGADGYAFWTWRPALGGVEQFHGALTDAGGRPQPVYAEAAQVGAEFARVRDVIAGTVPIADTAMLHDFPSRWAIRRQPMTVDFNPFTLFTDFYRAVRPSVAGVAVLNQPTDLKRYKLVVAPLPHVIDAAAAKALADYVRGGGHLVLGPRSGVKDPTNALWTPGAPGPLAALVGAHVDQTHVPPAPIAVTGDIATGSAAIWAERLAIDAPDVTVLMRYPRSADWLDDAPAVVTRRVGRGRVTYVGVWLDAAALQKLLAWCAAQAGAAPLLPGVPDGVEVAARSGGGRTTHVVINWATSEQSLPLPPGMTSLLDGAPAGPRLTLPPWGVAVLGQR